MYVNTCSDWSVKPARTPAVIYFHDNQSTKREADDEVQFFVLVFRHISFTGSEPQQFLVPVRRWSYDVTTASLLRSKAKSTCPRAPISSERVFDLLSFPLKSLPSPPDTSPKEAESDRSLLLKHFTQLRAPQLDVRDPCDQIPDVIREHLVM